MNVTATDSLDLLLVLFYVEHRKRLWIEGIDYRAFPEKKN